jgi:hypothetical protein
MMRAAVSRCSHISENKDTTRTHTGKKTTKGAPNILVEERCTNGTQLVLRPMVREVRTGERPVLRTCDVNLRLVATFGDSCRQDLTLKLFVPKVSVAEEGENQEKSTANNSSFCAKMKKDSSAEEYYLNGKGRLQNNVLVKLYIPEGLHHPKAAYLYARFVNENEWHEYEKELMEIKRTIATLNHEFSTGKYGEGELDEQLTKKWIPLTEAFMNKYSKEMVPTDVRWAINDVEQNLGKKVTTWPELIKITDEPVDSKTMSSV